MIRITTVAVVALGLCASCASSTKRVNQPYQPASKPEKYEFCEDRLDVFPDDVRNSPDRYVSNAVVWTGIIVSNDATELDTGNAIKSSTVFEHHYFDWVQDGSGKNIKLAVSPRGEGRFVTTWQMDKLNPDATVDNATAYAAKGRLAIVYGVPDKVAPDGTVGLKYRYIRILDNHHFSTNEFDYGRFGDSFTVLRNSCQATGK